MGKLFLLPTPLWEEGPLDSRVREVLLKAIQNPEETLIVVEEAKVARQRWSRWGLPREWLERFVLYNEHTVSEKNAELLKELKQKKNVYLLSDGGLPAFCDPGQELVDLCHRSKMGVTALGVDSSFMLAVILSGYPATPLRFLGFLPRQEEERRQALALIKNYPEMVVVMDTPYRLKAVLSAVSAELAHREIFLAMDLAGPQEELFRGPAKEALALYGERKREFILIFSPNHTKK